MTFETGARLDSHELVTLIGRGGMGEVWLARDTRLGRTVALKLLPPDLTADEPRRARFQREARAASGLNHPNICTIYSLGDAADGRLYLTMEYVGGDTLRQRLSHQALTIADALAISTAISSALCSAHEEHIVHRDIKPENVMIRRDGLVKVLDFGLAKLLAPTGETLETLERTTELAEHRTHPGTVLGTPAYMSPEQARGEAGCGRCGGRGGLHGIDAHTVGSHTVGSHTISLALWLFVRPARRLGSSRRSRRGFVRGRRSVSSRWQ